MKTGGTSIFFFTVIGFSLLVVLLGQGNVFVGVSKSPSWIESATSSILLFQPTTLVVPSKLIVTGTINRTDIMDYFKDVVVIHMIITILTFHRVSQQPDLKYFQITIPPDYGRFKRMTISGTPNQ